MNLPKVDLISMNQKIHCLLDNVELETVRLLEMKLQ